MGLTDKVKSKFADASDRLDDLERKTGKDDKGEDEAAPAQKGSSNSGDADGESPGDEAQA
jgi:hypothetical protein